MNCNEVEDFFEQGPKAAACDASLGLGVFGMVQIVDFATGQVRRLPPSAVLF